MTLSKQQRKAAAPRDYANNRYIWERDLLYMARENEAWRDKANALGFTDDKIFSPWSHRDEGRLITVPHSPEYLAACAQEFRP